MLVLEGAPRFYRGGNTRHTRNMRCAHDAATEILTDPKEEFFDDPLRITGGQTDKPLARRMIHWAKRIGEAIRFSLIGRDACLGLLTRFGGLTIRTPCT